MSDDAHDLRPAGKTDAPSNARVTVETEQQYANYDAGYTRVREGRSDVNYSQFQMAQIAQAVSEGLTHATLGMNLVDASGSKIDFWDAGRAAATIYMRTGKVAQGQRVIEYGCGSLRVGAHFISFLEPEKFYGVDIVDSFYEIGKAAIGETLLTEKRPRFDVISDSAVDNLAEFAADFIYSCAVCFHIHPDDIGFYFRALERITHKPGAVLAFEAALSKEPCRYRDLSWAWPLEFIRNSLPGLELVQTGKAIERSGYGMPISLARLVFRRPV